MNFEVALQLFNIAVSYEIYKSCHQLPAIKTIGQHIPAECIRTRAAINKQVNKRLTVIKTGLSWHQHNKRDLIDKTAL